MYGLKPDLDLSFFAGRYLSQICIGVADCILNFDDELTILVTSAIGYLDTKDAYFRGEDFRKAFPHIACLLNKTVSHAQGTPDGTLQIYFRDAGRLDIFDDSKQFESYVISHKEKRIVV